MEKISIAIPYHGDRVKWTMQTINNCHRLPFIHEIVISVDKSSDEDINKIRNAVKHYKKVKLFWSDTRLFVLKNKIRAVTLCNTDWVALIDSDNVVSGQYFGPWLKIPHIPNVIYCPEFGVPSLVYCQFSGIDITYNSLQERLRDKSQSAHLEMMMNTGNYIFFREAWLWALGGCENHNPAAADVFYANYNCLLHGMVLRVIKNMSYRHTVHKGSTYLKTAKESTEEVKRLKLLIEGDDENSGGIQTNKQNSLSAASNYSATGGKGAVLLSNEKAGDRPELLVD